ncbi:MULTISPECIES: HNH endonuclease [Burkholderia cepacia complex]
MVPKASGGTDLDENLQAICKDCHAAKTARERLR